MTTRKSDRPISELVPCQPLVDVDGVVRFRANPYVRWMYDKLLEVSGIGLNELVLLPEREKGFEEQPVADLVQLIQLLGRSVGGYEELDFVPDEEVERVLLAAKKFEKGGKR